MTNRNISDSRDFCYTLTEDAVRLFENLFRKHDLSVVIVAETVDGYEQSFKSSEEFFEWSQYPHAPLRELSFSTLRDEKRYQAILTFGNGRRFPFLDDRQSAAIFWSLKGPAQIVTDVNENITKIILSLKQNYTVFFGNHPLQSMAFSAVTLYVPLFVAFVYGFGLFMDTIVGSAASNQGPKYFRLPNGQVLEALPAIPIVSEDPPKFSHHGFWKYVGIPYVIICIILRCLRRLYPVGVFDFGYDRMLMSRRFATRDRVVWGLVIGGILASVISAIILGYFN